MAALVGNGLAALQLALHCRGRSCCRCFLPRVRRLSFISLVCALGAPRKDLHDKTLELAEQVAQELGVLSYMPGELPASFGLSMQELLSHAWQIPDEEETEPIQHLVLQLTGNLRQQLPVPADVDEPSRREAIHQARAMMSAVEATLPICRKSAVCIVDKLSMMLWRFAAAGSEELLDMGFSWPFYREMHRYLPPHARWETPWQCPTTLLPGLETRPLWALEELPAGSAARRLAFALRDGAEDIARDLEEGIKSREGMALVKDPAWSGLSRGTWMAFSLYRAEGFFGRHAVARQLDPLRCRLTPRTCRLLQEVRAPPGMVEHLPSLQGAQEVVDFLRADPGTSVHFHAASTNSRLTVQVCLSGCGPPDGGSGDTFLQAGPMRTPYRRGEPVIFDDSFLHRVMVDPASAEPRWVLSVQVLHPQIDSAERFAEHFARYTAPPSGEDPRDDPANGGPVPPALGEDARSAFPEEPLFFHNNLAETVLLYAAMWGPGHDGPEELLGEVPGVAERPYDGGRGLALPPLAHRSRLAARNIADGTEVAVWRVDVRASGARRFELLRQ